MSFMRTIPIPILAAAAGLLVARPAVAQELGGPPDAIFVNGKIVTVNRSFDIVEAVAVRDGRVLATGSTAEIERLAGPSTERIDFGGKTVLPGFYDCHAHLYRDDDKVASWPDNVHDLRRLDNVPDLLAALREITASTPQGEWINARISETGFPEQRLPDRWVVDQASPRHPVVLQRGPHSWVVNSLALERAGISRETPDPKGGKLERNERGEPNGVLREGAAQDLVGRLLPPEVEATAEEIRTDLYNQLRMLVGLGITSANIAGLRPGDPFAHVQTVYDRAGRELPRLTLQLRVSPGFDSWDDPARGARETIAELEQFGFHTGFGGDRLKIGAIKMSIDGGFTGQAAWLLEPYPDGSVGATRIPEDVLYRVGRAGHERGWQLGIHSIGDAATQMTVDVLARIVREARHRDHRHFLHHIEARPPDATIRTMAELGIGVCSQPNFTYDLATFYPAPLKGLRFETVNPQRSLIRSGVPVGYGSDHRPYGPIVAIWSAVTRVGRDGTVFGVELEGVSVQEAIRAATVGSAYLTFDDDERGSIEPGKLADLVVLTEDILTVPPERIREIGVERTIIGGRVVYTADRPMVARFDDGEIWYAGGESSRTSASR